MFFVINSEINSFKKSSTDLLESQVEIKKDAHPFLDHDSWIDCSKVIREFDASEVIRQNTMKIGGLRGALSNTVRRTIRTVVADSRTLEKRFKQAILEELIDC